MVFLQVHTPTVGPEVLSGLLRLHGIYFRKQVTCRLVEKRQKVVKRKPHRTVFVDEDVSTLRYAEEGNGVVEPAYLFIMIAEQGEGQAVFLWRLFAANIYNVCSMELAVTAITARAHANFALVASKSEPEVSMLAIPLIRKPAPGPIFPGTFRLPKVINT